mmetsp:Transcript_71845/g.126572  ORF Transcript_71845/g.126572 Transcript_71845/m.126572 type:complete len:245 (-) Transcript_71845:612-1346(-)
MLLTYRLHTAPLAWASAFCISMDAREGQASAEAGSAEGAPSVDAEALGAPVSARGLEGGCGDPDAMPVSAEGGRGSGSVGGAMTGPSWGLAWGVLCLDLEMILGGAQCSANANREAAVALGCSEAAVALSIGCGLGDESTPTSVLSSPRSSSGTFAVFIPSARAFSWRPSLSPKSPSPRPQEVMDMASETDPEGDSSDDREHPPTEVVKEPGEREVGRSPGLGSGVSGPFEGIEDRRCALRGTF